MLIGEWIDQNRMTVKEFATGLGCHFSVVYRWMARETMPQLKWAREIEKFTKGAVTVEELRGSYVIRSRASEQLSENEKAHRSSARS
jgi:DNA-binding transcriptional regulator YdaS (Cro superfamily)